MTPSLPPSTPGGPSIPRDTSVYLDSLGCAKNLVDSEATLGLLNQAGFRRVEDPLEAEVLLVNTCGFLEVAREESIERILQLAQCKAEGRARVLGVMGCLVTRAPDELMAAIPEVDVWLPAGHHGEWIERLQEAWHERPAMVLRRATDRSGSGRAPISAFAGFGNRVLLTPEHTAYLKISEGCSNVCSFCSIPLMRGQQRSRPLEDILQEAHLLAAGGVKELHLVAQDLTHYGFDLRPRLDLLDLATALADVEGIAWIRLLYAHPKHLTDRLLHGLFEIPEVVRYLDMPIQHASDRLLAAMSRPYSSALVRKQLLWLRKNVPDITLRSTVIVGFPGEQEDDFRALCDFVEEVQYDRLGIFCYSREPGTTAYSLPHRVRSQTAQRRLNELAERQLHIASEKSASRVGKRLSVLVDHPLAASPVSGDALPEWARTSDYIGRSEAEALDIDGQIFLRAAGTTSIQTGSFVTAEITQADVFDLEGRVVEERCRESESLVRMQT